jgi:hypothetical protein
MDLLLTSLIALIGFILGMLADICYTKYTLSRESKAPSWLDMEFEDMLSESAKISEQRVNVTSTSEKL